MIKICVICGNPFETGKGTAITCPGECRRQNIKNCNRRKVERNKQLYKEINRLWRKKNADRCIANSRRWYENNREYAKQRAQHWRQKNKGRHLLTSAKYYKNNTDRCRESMKCWADNNPYRIRELKRIWRVKNIARAREQSRNHQGRRSAPTRATANFLQTLKLGSTLSKITK